MQKTKNLFSILHPTGHARPERTLLADHQAMIHIHNRQENIFQYLQNLELSTKTNRLPTAHTSDID